MVVFLMVFAVIVFFVPEMGGYFLEHNNFIPADPLKTPPHIAPVWYFTPYYAILRAVPPLFEFAVPGRDGDGRGGADLFFLLPWLDRGPVKSIRYAGRYYKIALAFFVVVFLILGYLGTSPLTSSAIAGMFAVSARCSLYFAFFLLMPWYTRHGPSRSPSLTGSRTKDGESK